MIELTLEINRIFKRRAYKMKQRAKWMRLYNFRSKLSCHLSDYWFLRKWREKRKIKEIEKWLNILYDDWHS